MKSIKKKKYSICSYYGNHCVTTKETSLIIAEVLENIILQKNKAVISKIQRCMFLRKARKFFKEKTKKIPLVLGDITIHLYPDSGTVVMTLSDGMGTGELHLERNMLLISGTIYEAGFSKITIKLINSVMLIRLKNKYIQQ